ncbi:MAG: nickel pincer cofactor biosynthesis protein LarC [Nitrospira sp. SB0667_bin_9]|nr:nickel pincer cofactor biosynthesis protein LarC [Nitrospira sp. SB0667_bin_9]MYD30764.1 nickel pincer cofactor biosynthesis protein LarC [Nitrospira sp. SB0661_bin_20]MYJ23159.1 nickel pincer cofactor biosynthesis protein LarC [Nitrospira sp. SB0673_bin_12]
MHLHFDCFSGISGDMTLGALVDVGLSPRALRQGLKALPVSGYRLKVSEVHRGAIHATKVDVVISKIAEKRRSWMQIRRLLSTSRLPSQVKKQALAVFERLATAEGRVHGQDPANVSFHEVGAIDALVDIVGGLLGCHELGVKTFSASAVNVGSGTIDATHGVSPVPGPAVAEMAKGYPIYSQGPAMELTTPTGMALLTTLTQNVDRLPLVVPGSVGYGAGTADPPDWPNVLRVFLADTALTPSSLTPFALTPTPLPGGEGFEADQVILLETNIDDMNPQLYEAVMERLFENGALDVCMTPTIMKRNRPGIILTVLTHPEHAGRLTQLLFHETTTLGVRSQPINRTTLPRSMQTIRLPQGRVRVKTIRVGKAVKHRPEFQDCQAIAKKTGMPIQEVIERVMQAIRDRNRG